MSKLTALKKDKYKALGGTKVQIDTLGYIETVGGQIGLPVHDLDVLEHFKKPKGKYLIEDRAEINKILFKLNAAAQQKANQPSKAIQKILEDLGDKAPDPKELEKLDAVIREKQNELEKLHSDYHKRWEKAHGAGHKRQAVIDSFKKIEGHPFWNFLGIEKFEDQDYYAFHTADVICSARHLEPVLSVNLGQFKTMLRVSDLRPCIFPYKRNWSAYHLTHPHKIYANNPHGDFCWGQGAYPRQRLEDSHDISGMLELWGQILTQCPPGYCGDLRNLKFASENRCIVPETWPAKARIGAKQMAYGAAVPLETKK